MVTLHHGDCLDILQSLPDASIDACVTDPPYGLSDHSETEVQECLRAWTEGRPYLTKNKGGFMGRSWDKWVPGPEVWREVFRVLKPGGHALVFAGTRSDDLMGIALRMAGFEIRDKLMWLYGTGMSKGLNVGKAIDKAAGAKREVVGFDASRLRPNRKYEGGAIGKIGGTGKASDRTDNGATITAPATEEAKQWDGWGTSLKPAYEPIIVVRKPLEGTVVANVLKHGVGAINIDASRVPFASDADRELSHKNGLGPIERFKTHKAIFEGGKRSAGFEDPHNEAGRFPANVLHDSSDEVMAAFAAYGERKSGVPGIRRKPHETHSMSGRLSMTGKQETGYADAGSIARYFYSTKATAKDRMGSEHPTVKPLALMRYLVRLVTPVGGVVLDPFAGSGTTGQAAAEQGFDVVLMEQDAEFIPDIQRRCAAYMEGVEVPPDDLAPDVEDEAGPEVTKDEESVDDWFQSLTR